MQPEHMVYNQRQFLQQKWGWKKNKQKKLVGCAKIPLKNNPLYIWGLHILPHQVESEHQTGNRCWASES